MLIVDAGFGELLMMGCACGPDYGSCGAVGLTGTAGVVGGTLAAWSLDGIGCGSRCGGPGFPWHISGLSTVGAAACGKASAVSTFKISAEMTKKNAHAFNRKLPAQAKQHRMQSRWTSS